MCDKVLSTEEIPATGHKYSDYVIKKDATETEDGILERTCTVCGETEKVTIPKLESLKTEVKDEKAENPLASQYTKGEDITFTAIGIGMDNVNPQAGDMRYVPAKWSINPSGEWTSAPYTATFAVANAGDYELKVVYNREVYKDGKWVADGVTITSKTAITIAEKAETPDNGNNGNTNNDSTTPSGDASIDNNASVSTGDTSMYADGGGHAWNAVKLDNGKWYLSDLTWSDDSIRIDKDHFGDTAGVNSINTAFVNMPYKTFSQRHSQNLTFKALEYADDSDYYNFYDVYITLEQENTLSKEEITKIVSDKIIELLKNNISKAVIVYENFEYYEYPEVFFAACSLAFKNIYNETGVEWTYTLGEPCSSDLLWDLKDEEGNYILNENNERIKLMRSNVLFSVKEQSGEYTFLKYNIPGNGAYITASDYIGSKILNIPENLNGLKVIKIGDVNTIDCEKVILPSTVKIIGGGGFRGSKIKKIELNDGLIRIDYEAFLNCEELKSVYIPESVNVIENYAFGYVFGDNGFEKTDGFTIYGEAGSAAQKYAEDNGFAFIEGRMNEITYGDANGDGKIDSRDAVVIKKYVAGFTGFTIDLDAADVNADGKVDTRDAVKILKKIAGFDVTLGEA